MDIGLINKYYYLTRTSDRLAVDHYTNLAVKTSACTECGHCDETCQFHVDQASRMDEIHGYFRH